MHSMCICSSVCHSVCLSIRAKRGIQSKRVLIRKRKRFLYSLVIIELIHIECGNHFTSKLFLKKKKWDRHFSGNQSVIAGVCIFDTISYFSLSNRNPLSKILASCFSKIKKTNKYCLGNQTKFLIFLRNNCDCMVVDPYKARKSWSSRTQI